MATPHIRAEKGDIAEKILLPGDPLRAKFISENFLQNSVQFNDIRNMLGFTGIYKGEKVSVMGTGMGVSSIGIYSYELIKFFDVKKLIRVGTCGSYKKDVGLHDIILAQGASTNSNFQSQYELNGTYSAISSFNLLERAANILREKNYKFHVGGVLTSDIFYEPDENSYKKWASLGVLAVEMETYALYCNASRLGAEALSILSVSDQLVTKEAVKTDDREKAFTKMMEVALEI
ncbi:purine-nucleoside phosphorylase [Citroniella saccharovorans]|uniref:Purine nucleoside phosphorylase DeoD-type n=1 Tax=Citroniella saccharovorans TaxID=2053367 RepID=A0AAW9MVD2_9FIRM|nr:purine-nucleoside phosphorylase [Citroniella saccharovorans]MEB3428450.1 purine-nucleoside phosphorylase [Citroniella saccharovorans]